MTELHDRIATLAHSIWETEGRIHGKHEEHWLRAERILAAPPQATKIPPRLWDEKETAAVEPWAGRKIKPGDLRVIQEKLAAMGYRRTESMIDSKLDRIRKELANRVSNMVSASVASAEQVVERHRAAAKQNSAPPRDGDAEEAAAPGGAYLLSPPSESADRSVAPVAADTGHSSEDAGRVLQPVPTRPAHGSSLALSNGEGYPASERYEPTQLTGQALLDRTLELRRLRETAGR